MPEPLISIIMAAYNSEKYISDAIGSVIKQSYHNWELLIINDGSFDNTHNIVTQLSDPRIKYYYHKTNNGVSYARNLGIKIMDGDYFCFFDTDDIMPSNSIQSRLNIFIQNPELSFVDGAVITKNYDMSVIKRKYIPSFTGIPYENLLTLNSNCYFGPTWLIKRENNVSYRFIEHMSHAEDLYFFISISQGKKYSYTIEEVLHYRITHNSAMSNLDGLKNGYNILFDRIKDIHKPKFSTLLLLKIKIKKIMFLSYMFDGKMPIKAIKSLFFK